MYFSQLINFLIIFFCIVSFSSMHKVITILNAIFLKILDYSINLCILLILKHRSIQVILLRFEL